MTKWEVQLKKLSGRGVETKIVDLFTWMGPVYTPYWETLNELSDEDFVNFMSDLTTAFKERSLI